MNLREQQEIFRALAEGDHPPGSALATIVRTTGSTYRRAGARLLVGPEGPLLGNLSGGCLEDEISDACRRVVQINRPITVTYDLSSDDEAIWGWGLGCNGAMEVFIEPASAAHAAAQAVMVALNSGRAVTMLTAISSSDDVAIGTRVLMSSDGTRMVGSGSDAFQPDDIQGLIDPDAQVPIIEVAGVDVSVERIAPQPRVVIVGAGHDAIPLSSSCSSSGFDVIVIDDRTELLSQDRFPAADELAPAQDLVDRLRRSTEAFTAVIVMTHNYLKDLDYLATLIAYCPEYLGVLGPRARLDRLLAELAKRGVEPTPDLDLRGPAGLDLGAEGPEEIAVAITAEILAAYHGRSGGPLKEREGPIHGDAG